MNRLIVSAAVMAAWMLSACSSGGADAPPKSPSVTITASPAAISSGQNVTLTWNATDANACSGSGSWSGSPPVSGSQTFPINNPGHYIFVLTCTGPGGSNAAAAEVTVSGGSSGGQISVSLAADPTSVAVGQSTTLTWSAQDAQSCTASGDWSGTKDPTGSAAVVVSKAGYNSYVLSCTGPAGSGSQQVYVQGLQASVAISASPTTTGAGQTTTLIWSSTYASTCTASGDWSGTKAANGSELVTVPSLGDHTYSLTCSDPGAAATSSATATGVAPSVALFGAFPDQPVVGETVTLNWDTTYATDCTASQGWSGAQSTKGSKTLAVTAPGAVSYTITCNNGGGSDAKTIQVTSVAAPALPPATAYQMNPRHDGTVTFSGGITLPLTAAPAWSRDLGQPVSYPLIAEGLVFVVSKNTDDSYGNRLFALNETTGATVWGPVALPGTYFWNGTAYDKGRLFTLNFDGKVRAFNAANGAALWTAQMPGYWHDAEPVAFGGMVFATGNYGTVGFDAATGNPLWTRPYYGENACPAVTSQGLYLVQGWNAGAIALNPVTGDDLWTATISSDYGADIAVHNGTAYARYSDSSLFMADASTGASTGSGASNRALAVTDSIMLTLYSGTLTATNLATGTQKWTFTGDGNLVSAPIVVNNTVFVGSSSGKVYALDATSGSQLWFGTTAAMNAPDQWNGALLPGPAAGEGWLVMSGGNTVAAWHLK